MDTGSTGPISISPRNLASMLSFHLRLSKKWCT
jgi:hypothetical protein